MTTTAAFTSRSNNSAGANAIASPPNNLKSTHRTHRAEVFDRRRRQGRDIAESLVARAEYLLPKDRALINAIYRDGSSAREVASLTDATPRAVRRRIRSLAQRVLDPRFAFVIIHREQWPPTRRKVATETILHGLPLRAAAKSLDLSLHTVRRHADAIRVMYEALGR